MTQISIMYLGYGYKFILFFNGRLKPNVAPLSLKLFSAHIFPSCASTIFFEIYNPKPVPLLDCVTNFVNIFGNISEDIPVPVSFIITQIALS